MAAFQNPQGSHGTLSVPWAFGIAHRVGTATSPMKTFPSVAAATGGVPTCGDGWPVVRLRVTPSAVEG
jgi:hypothetical protein